MKAYPHSIKLMKPVIVSYEQTTGFHEVGINAMKLDENIILSDPSVSFWLKNAIEESKRRDPINALSDAELLTKLLQQRCEQAFNQDIGNIII